MENESNFLNEIFGWTKKNKGKRDQGETIKNTVKKKSKEENTEKKNDMNKETQDDFLKRLRNSNADTSPSPKIDEEIKGITESGLSEVEISYETHKIPTRKRMANNHPVPFTRSEEKEEKQDAVWLLVDLIIDTTKSMELIWDGIKPKLISLINSLEAKTETFHGDIVLKWGLTFLTSDGVECKELGISSTEENLFFTDNIVRIKKALDELENNFRGGKFDGREPINDALCESIQKLNKVRRKPTKRGLILLTDSIPKNDPAELNPDFREKGELRFAFCYSYSPIEYRPDIKVVDGDGYASQTDKNRLIHKTIKEFLNNQEQDEIGQMINKILDAASMGGE